MKKKKKVLTMVLAMALLAMGGYAWLWCRHNWGRVWEPTPFRQPYRVAVHHDDTLRVAMIGDSWVELHQELGCDTLVQGLLQQWLGVPVKVMSKGRGGAQSRAVYELMFHDTAGSDARYCTEDMLRQGADYCVVIAGINDAAANMGPRFYLRHYNLILATLHWWRMRPVVIEIPDVDIDYVYGAKNFKHRLGDRCRAWLTGSGMYDVGSYREALRERLRAAADSVVYVPFSAWNPQGYRDSTLYQPDRIHLNGRGYQRLDSCIAAAIARDYRLKAQAPQEAVDE